jgi:integrase
VSRMEFGDGLAEHPGFKRKGIAIYLDDDYQVLEAPTKWMLKIAKLRSRSDETSRGYAYILGRYLQWLDDQGYGCNAWQSIDEDIFDQYLIWLVSDSSRAGVKHETLYYYASRIFEFYVWAQKEGYPHYLSIKLESVRSRFNANELLLGHLGNATSSLRPQFNLPTGRAASYQRELDKFVIQSDYEAALELIDDPVFQVIAAVIRLTALRPKDLLQIPYRGSGLNKDFVPYDLEDMPSDLDQRELFYEFASKGKRRSIAFPGMLWRVICEVYIPLRRERAKIYAAKHGISPSNSVLFLTAEGVPANYPLIRYNFGRITKKADLVSPKKFMARKFTARMLRHTCATYFVYEGLKQRKLLGKPYIYDAAMDEELRKLLGHVDVTTTYKYYVHMVNRFVHDDLLTDLHRSQCDASLNVLLDRHGYLGGKQ